MERAHCTRRRTPRAFARASCARSEAGYSLIELMVVMLIVAIVSALSAEGLESFMHRRNDPSYVVASGVVWHGIAAYRIDHAGAFPPSAELASAHGSTFVDDGGNRYVRDWPNDPATGSALQIHQGSGTLPPLTGSPSSVVYSARGATGWFAAYDAKGKLQFDRGDAATGAFSPGSGSSVGEGGGLVPVG